MKQFSDSYRPARFNERTVAEAPASGPSAHSEGKMHATVGRESTAGDGAEARQSWFGNSVWRSPEVELLSIKAWASITAASYHRGAGESVWRGDRHRIVLTLDLLPAALVQIEQGRTQECPLAPPGALAFSPAGLMIRSVHPAGRFVHVVWDTDLYSTLLPELGAAASRFEYMYLLEDPLLSQIITTLAQEIEGCLGDKILNESLGTGLCIRIAQRFIGRLPLPTSKGLSPERLQRVRDYVEAHLDGGLSLTVLADVACLSPFHFGRSFKEAAGVGASTLCHATSALASKNPDAAHPPAPRVDRAGGRVCRPESSDLHFPPRDGGDTWPVSRLVGVSQGGKDVMGSIRYRPERADLGRTREERDRISAKI